VGQPKLEALKLFIPLKFETLGGHLSCIFGNVQTYSYSVCFIYH